MRALFRTRDGFRGIRRVRYPAPPTEVILLSRPPIRHFSGWMDLNYPLNMAPGSVISVEDADYFMPLIETRKYERVTFIDGGNDDDSFAEYREV